MRTKVQPISFRCCINPSSHAASQHMGSLHEKLKIQNTFMQSWSNYHDRNPGKTLERLSSRLSSNMMMMTSVWQFQGCIRFWHTLIQWWKVSLFECWCYFIFALSTDETKPFLNYMDIISSFALCVSKYPSGSLVAGVVQNHCKSPQIVNNIAQKACPEHMRTPSFCGAEHLLKGHFLILMLFGIIWKQANTPQSERENLVSPLTC